MDINLFLLNAAKVLLVVGGLNWLLVGLIGLDLVARIFGPGTVLSRVVYVLVGLAALYIGLLWLGFMGAPVEHEVFSLKINAK